ncbi:MAG: peptidase U32 family protein [Bacilli bacterium]|jgi:putative protease
MFETRKKPELLAPAGNLEKLKWAIKYGADAVYIGGKNYGLRANNDNFAIEEIKAACLYAHQNQVKVYVTVNIIFHNKDLKGLKEYLIALDKCRVDAFIISDPLVLDIAKKYTPRVDLFLSTQQSTLNYEAVLFWKKAGIKRIILAREASKEDIKEIIDKTKMDLEVFIHGAMCINYSGKCLLSNYITNRDSNRGGCSQICRWSFQLIDQNNKDLNFQKKFRLSSKDLIFLKYIPDLMEMGVTSFKIEGRMRSIYYIATIINIYRQVIDEYYNNKEQFEYNKAYEKILKRCANRETIEQYFEKKADIGSQYFSLNEEVSNQDFLGIVLGYDKVLKEVSIEQRNFFQLEDEVEIFGPHQKIISFFIKRIKDDDGQDLEAARHPCQIVRIPLKEEVFPDDLMRIKM